MKTTHKGITLITACQAIHDKNKKIALLQNERDILCDAAIEQYELKSFAELQKYYSKVINPLTKPL